MKPALSVFLVLLAGCSFLTTRQPEDPDAGNSSFIPPTSPDIVVRNFTNAISERNIQTWVSCFLDTDTSLAPGIARMYRFEPTAQVAAQYGPLFLDWSIERERQSFTTYAALPQVATNPPVLILGQTNFDVVTPDSAILLSPYRFVPRHSYSGLSDTLTGSIRLSIVRSSSGFWYIGTWSDFSANDTSATWSLLKARLVN